MKHGFAILALGGLLVAGLVGCSAPLGSTAFDREAAAVASATAPRTEMVLTRAEAPRLERSPVFERVDGPVPVPAGTTTWAAPCAAPCATPCPTPCPTPCAPRCWSGCGLPCAEGFSDWHLRGVIGYSFHAGTDSGDGNLYYGADVGWTSACCWGIDAFYRRHCGTFDREFPIVGATVFEGEDGGTFNHIGVKLTYQKAFGGSRWYGYAGAGPQYFWTEDYLDDDTGIGGFAELGIGYVLKKNWRVRAGVEVLGQSTSAGRLSPIDDDEDRLLWFISPVFEIELAL